jgi:hypothetical protein
VARQLCAGQLNAAIQQAAQIAESSGDMIA